MNKLLPAGPSWAAMTITILPQATCRRPYQGFLPRTGSHAAAGTETPPGGHHQRLQHRRPRPSCTPVHAAIPGQAHGRRGPPPRRCLRPGGSLARRPTAAPPCDLPPPPHARRSRPTRTLDPEATAASGDGRRRRRRHMCRHPSQIPPRGATAECRGVHPWRPRSRSPALRDSLAPSATAGWPGGRLERRPTMRSRRQGTGAAAPTAASAGGPRPRRQRRSPRPTCTCARSVATAAGPGGRRLPQPRSHLHPARSPERRTTPRLRAGRLQPRRWRCRPNDIPALGPKSAQLGIHPWPPPHTFWSPTGSRGTSATAAPPAARPPPQQSMSLRCRRTRAGVPRRAQAGGHCQRPCCRWWGSWRWETPCWHTAAAPQVAPALLRSPSSGELARGSLASWPTPIVLGCYTCR
mmetsp:Transcript_16974/g.44051  ORF Transcript_16974/g.44051 Transcript_16974/m.44051 type:complete len:408 (+) Transcript_16974:109-1332(+)